MAAAFWVSEDSWVSGGEGVVGELAADVAGVESVREFAVDAEGDEDGAHLWHLEVNCQSVSSLPATSGEDGSSKALPLEGPRALGSFPCADIDLEPSARE